jgi:serine acetyltransferase
MNTMNIDSKLVQLAKSIIQGYNHAKYWKRRAIVINPNSKYPLFLRLYYLFYIKCTDARWRCSFGTNLGSGTIFKTPPKLLHGPNQIIVGHDWLIGSQCTMAQGVTIQCGGGEIGDNVLLGANAFVCKGVIIGNNVKVGAGAIVTDDVPDGATVVLQKSRIILKQNN